MTAADVVVRPDDGMDTAKFIRAHLAPLEHVLPAKPDSTLAGHALAGKRVLDAGCGRGALARALAGDGADVIGIDPGEEAIAFARKGRSSVRFEIARAEAMPFADDTFDAILFVNALHHISAQAMRPALIEAHRVGVHDARLIVVEPLAQGSFNEVLRLIDDEAGIRARAQEALHDIARHEGFSLLETLTYTRREAFADADVFITRVTAVDPERAATAATQGTTIADAFVRHAVRDPSGRYWLDQPLKADAFALR